MNSSSEEWQSNLILYLKGTSGADTKTLIEKLYDK
jgi:hypothetical protein